MSNAAISYGSDQQGLIWAYRFESEHPGLEIDATTALQWLAESQRQPHAPSSFVWLHFTLANTAAVRWMQSQLHLPQAFYDSLHEAVPSTRLEQEEAALVAVLHDVHYEGEFDSAKVSSLSACLEPGLLVSARLTPLRSVERLRASVRSGMGFRSSAELLAQLMREQANVLVDIVRQSTVRVDSIEDNLLTGRVSSNRQELGAMRRALIRLRRLLAPEPAALFRLLSKPPSWVSEADLQDLRQAGEEFSTAVADSVELAERVRLLQEELSASVNEQTNRTLFILTLVTVLALPINLVTGMFGMNVGGIPLAQHRHGFLVVVLILLVITGLVAHLLRLFRRRDSG